MSTEKGEGFSKSSQSEAAQAKQKSDPPTEPQTPSPTASTSGPSQLQQHPSSSTIPPPITTPSRLFDEQQQQQLAAVSSSSSSQPKTPPPAPPEDERKQQAASTKRDQASASTSPSTLETATYAGGGAGIAGGGDGGGGRDGTAASAEDASSLQRPRQVIAVSASKGPAAFFNLARKFLVTDEMCDLSALEGAIVSAVDAAHLLERSKLATIVRVQTSYVSVEPKRRKQPPSPHPTQPQQPGSPPAGTSIALPPTSPAGTAPALSVVAGTPQPHMGGVTDTSQQQRPRRGNAGRELRRARIVITVRRTENYKRWLEENPLQAIIAGDGTVDDYADDKATADSTDD